MRPGQFPWATDDLWTAGPDVGSDTKGVIPQADQDEGYFRQRRPGPDVWNYQLYKAYLAHLTASRVQAMNYQQTIQDATANRRAMLSACYVKTTPTTGAGTATGGADIYCFFFKAAAPNNVECGIWRDGVYQIATITQVALGAFGVSPIVDAEGCESDHVVCTIDDAAGAIVDEVNYAIGGAWNPTTWNPGAPTLDWRSVGCDRDTEGNGYETWCIGDDAGGGNSEIWRSIDGIDFATVGAGWPGATVTEPIHGIYHACHPANAMLPADVGNPAWLALSDTYASRSIDGGNTWTATAHGLALGASSFNAKSAAYSRPSTRWVVAIPGNNFGDIAYSDDNGLTWTTLASALPGAISGAAVLPHIAGDGYGTFVITGNHAASDSEICWVSVDEGLTWSTAHLPIATGGTTEGLFPIGAFDQQKLIFEPGDFNQFFSIARYDVAGPILELYRSLLV